MDAGVGLLHRRGVVTVGELHVHQAHRAELAVLHHGAGLLHHLVAGVAVHHTQHAALGLGQGLQLQRFFQTGGQRLFANHVQSGLQGRFADCVVRTVGRGDADHLDAVRAGSLGGEHGLVIAVAAFGRQPQTHAKAAAPRSVQVEGPGAQLHQAVAGGGVAVRVADLAALATADHAPAQGRVE